jgi:hypothetical protein
MRIHVIVPALLVASSFAAPAFAQESGSGATVSTGSQTSVIDKVSVGFKARIDGNYKVIGNLDTTVSMTLTTEPSPALSLYEVRVTRPGKDDAVFVVDAAKDKFEDWSAVPGKNVYVATAVFSDGSRYPSEPVTIYMGPNGEASTAAAIESAAKARENDKQESTKKEGRDEKKQESPTENTGATSEETTKSEKREEKKEEKKSDEATRTTTTTASGSTLSADMRSKIEAKFDAVPEEKREKFLMKLVSRIDSAIAKNLAAKRPKTVAMLREIRALAEDRLNSMDEPDEGTVVNELLQDGE